MAILNKFFTSKHFCILFIITICGCSNNNSNNNSIPTTRKNVNNKPIASYVIPMGDPKLDRKFGVEIFETPETYKYLLVMYYDGTVQNDTLNVPNLGISPVVKINPGNEKLSCIIGFLDNKNEFREYKMLSVKNDQLRLTTLKKYSVAGE